GMHDFAPPCARSLPRGSLPDDISSAVTGQAVAVVRVYLFEGSVMLMRVKSASNGAAGHKNVRPAVVVKIRGAHSETVRARGNPLVADEGGNRRTPRNYDAGSLRNVLERSIAAIVIQDIGAAA